MPTLESILLLVASLLPLALGPALVGALKKSPGRRLALGAGVGVAVSGLLLLHVLPHALGVAGWVVLPLALVGWILSLLLHRWGVYLRSGLLHVAMAGLALHAILDGVALVGAGVHSGEGGGGHAHDEVGLLLALSVVVHRLPVAMAIWSLGGRKSKRTATILLLAVAIATVAGFFLGGWLLPLLSSPALAWVQALLAGLLIHLVSEGPSRGSPTVPWLLGALAGLSLVVASFGLHPPEAAMWWWVAVLMLWIGQWKLVAKKTL